MKYQTISMKQFFPAKGANLLCSHRNGDIFTCENNMLFSRVKISCFRAKAHLVFHWCLYNNAFYYINTNEIPGELSRENVISTHVKIPPLLWLHDKSRFSHQNY